MMGLLLKCPRSLLSLHSLIQLRQDERQEKLPRPERNVEYDVLETCYIDDGLSDI